MMLFACLTAPDRRRGHRGGRRGGGARRAARRPGGAVRARGLAAHPQLQRRDRRVRSPRRSAPRTGPRSSPTAGPTAIEFEWQPDGGLRTRQRRSAVVRHPVTGQRCWFNQIAFLNEWTIDPEVREYLVDVYGADGLPFNTRFGDGDPIGEDVVELLNERLRGQHRARAVAGRRPDAGRQHPHRAQPRALRGAARGAGRRWPTRCSVGRRSRGREVTRVTRPHTDVRAGAAPPFAVISGAQVQQALQGQREAGRRAGRGHLPGARRGRLGEPAVLLPALPGPPDVADHRAARLARRRRPGRRPEVDLQLPGERGGRDPAGPRPC